MRQGSTCTRPTDFQNFGRGSLDEGVKEVAQKWSDARKRAFPLNPVDWAALAAPPPDTVQAVWMDGFTFITDPVFSERCAPVQFAGPKRLVAPALTCEEPQMPALDFVLLSHNHYDHLDTGSVRSLHRRYGKGLTWYVPLGLRSWFASEGVTNVVELDWWQSVTHASDTSNKSVVITMVPAQHWAARGVRDRCRSLWGGYVRPGTGTGRCRRRRPGRAPASAPAPPRPLRFYFVGDTGYCPVFTEIGKRFAPIDLAAVPIGAYDPRWFMKPQHVLRWQRARRKAGINPDGYLTGINKPTSEDFK
ncbi:N-acyl-phosphatidylethanolamine-hydrolyzing phospholipase D [Tetrabaena socialis]|uniref:N-acyl-phosphatidylethanolamine-hydrolyzing phospholipase D n=1 Tax=Tetrabaena socialis TaxID=47790 RepID=A0A2J7ZUK1_9CHLO|nr:N-acyl-phosphatidylethanolamine-hydrolyzing phospholipase D [Tetrabaena socialis]|eukprot:PNH03963.1 N-acyl-phosphatidylethanolamine-hydrolyzing phospholipase D [Tetrabaena socialis]